MAKDDSDKTEDPTAKRQEDSREKGQLGKSQDFNSAIMLFSSILFLYLFGYTLVDMHMTAGQSIFDNLSDLHMSRENLSAQIHSVSWYLAKTLVPFFLFIFVMGVFVNIVQIGFLWTFKPMAPDPNRINPIKGLQQKFSLKTLMIGFMNVAKVSAMSYVAYAVISSEWATLFRMTGQEIPHSLGYFSYVFFKLSFYMLIILFILGIIDFSYQKWQNFSNMRMSKQEVKDEHKNYEGDPKLKQKRRQIQLQMSRQRMMKDVKDADVVITNPTHLSIGIKYDQTTMRAPVVVAKGADLLALRIRQIAKENKITIVENKPVARALYQAVEVGDPIPEKIFKAVAEILAYVYNLKKDKSKPGARG